MTRFVAFSLRQVPLFGGSSERPKRLLRCIYNRNTFAYRFLFAIHHFAGAVLLRARIEGCELRRAPLNTFSNEMAYSETQTAIERKADSQERRSWCLRDATPSQRFSTLFSYKRASQESLGTFGRTISCALLTSFVFRVRHRSDQVTYQESESLIHHYELMRSSLADNRLTLTMHRNPGR